MTMTAKAAIIAALLLLGLAGCAATGERDVCLAAGFRQGTAEFADCLSREDFARYGYRFHGSHDEPFGHW